jgi:hypothetical protein
LLTTRNDEQRKKMRERLLNASPNEKESFMRAYRKHNLGLLPFWRLIGPNAHTFLIIFFMFIGRFDIFIIFFDLIIFNLIIWGVGILQKNADQKFFLEVKL